MNEPDDTTTPPSRRLNPFAFPSETDQRFVLFAIAAVTWVLSWGLIIIQSSMEVVMGNEVTVDAPLIAKLALPAIVVLAAMVLYWKHPARVVRKQELEPFDPTKDARMQSEVEHLTAVAGLREQPQLMLRRVKQTGGQVFGLRGAYVVRLDEGLRLVVRKAPPMFRAIVLHELAHIVNRDIGRTYFAQSLWSATQWIAIIPFLVILLISRLVGPRISQALQGGLTSAELDRLFTESLPAFMVLLVPFMVSVFMAYSIRASLLRVRETEADWRAATWGAEHALKGILERSAAATPGGKAGVRGRIAAIFKLHPTAQDRLRALEAPDQLFRQKPEVALFAGWLATTILLGAIQVFPEVRTALIGFPMLMVTALESASSTVSTDVRKLLVLLARLIMSVTRLLTYAEYIVVSLMVIGSLGLQVLREAVSDLSRYQGGFARYGRLIVMALLAVFGLHLGIATSSLGHAYATSPDLRHLYLRFALSAFPIMIVFVWTSLAGLRFFGQRLLGTKTGTKPPVARRRLLVLCFSGLFAIFLYWFVNTSLVNLNSELLLRNPAANPNMAEGLLLWQRHLDDVRGRLIRVCIIGFPVGWLVTVAWRGLRPPRCPQCRAIARQKHVLGKNCASCGADLAPWLFVS